MRMRVRGSREGVDPFPLLPGGFFLEKNPPFFEEKKRPHQLRTALIRGQSCGKRTASWCCLRLYGKGRARARRFLRYIALGLLR